MVSVVSSIIILSSLEVIVVESQSNVVICFANCFVRFPLGLSSNLPLKKGGKGFPPTYVKKITEGKRVQIGER